MNETQYDALNRRDRARAHMRLKQHEYTAAIDAFTRATDELDDAIAADPASWGATL